MKVFWVAGQLKLFFAYKPPPPTAFTRWGGIKKLSISGEFFDLFLAQLFFAREFDRRLCRRQSCDWHTERTA